MAKIRKTKIRDDNYVVIHGWMVKELTLKGNELMIYAIIYGFTQAGNQFYTSGTKYLADWTNSTERGIRKSLKSLSEKGLLERHVIPGSVDKLRTIRPSKLEAQQLASPEQSSSPEPRNSVPKDPELSSYPPLNSVPQSPELCSSPPYNNSDNNTGLNLSVSQSETETFHEHSTVGIVAYDGQTDGSPPKRKYRKYSDMLVAIGSPLADSGIKSEDKLAEYDENARFTKSCLIPYEMRENPSQLVQALRYLMAYSYRMKDEDDETKYFTDSVIDCLTELIHYGECSGTPISSAYIVKSLNEINQNLSLADWMFEFMDFWKNQIADRDIHHPKAYLRKCCYTYLQEYKIRNVLPALR